MTNSPRSESSAGEIVPDAFALLHPGVQRWIWDHEWQSLRPTQLRAASPILAADRDVLISATTASGKTEAAWLPILSRLAFDAEVNGPSRGVVALYISPLKALINDQASRLTEMAGYVDLAVSRRHGDVTGAERDRVVKDPSGLLLITPESLEALFVTRGHRIPTMFPALRYVVIDELHSFMGGERGVQVQSLLQRLETATGQRPVRIGLSATISDLDTAAEFLHPGEGRLVTILTGEGEAQAEVQLQVRGYLDANPHGFSTDPKPVVGTSGAELVGMSEPIPTERPEPASELAITDHLYRTLRGKDNLVFANAKAVVEKYSDRLRRRSDRERVPNEFFAHHGNLARELREEVENRLRNPETPTTAVCTSTLELGIDIGAVDAIAQLRAPYSVSALRQRLGRSGRRGDPAVLRVYVPEIDIDPITSVGDRLRVGTVQTVAVIELLIAKWYEPPGTSGLHLSTLIQQILSSVAQHGGVRAANLYPELCGHGPFSGVSRTMFVQLLRDMATKDLLMQSPDGTLLPGETGERLLNHYSFFAAFQTDEEFRLVALGKTLGSIPVTFPLMEGNLLVFAGERWTIIGIDPIAKVIELIPSSGGRPPEWESNGPPIADGIRRKMREVYLSEAVPAYLDAQARENLAVGRSHFRSLRLNETPLVQSGSGTEIVPFRGDIIMNTMGCLLAMQGIKFDHRGVSLHCNAGPEQIRAAAMAISRGPKPNPVDLAKLVKNKAAEKYDHFLGDDLLNEEYAHRSLDLDSVWEGLSGMLMVGE